MSKPSVITPTEHQIQNAIIGFLRFKGWYVQRLNSGKFAAGEGRSRRFIQGVKAGTPDIMAFMPNMVLLDGVIKGRGVKLLFVEVKRPGNKPTALQAEVMRELEEYGARCIVAHSVEEVEAAL